MADMDTWTMKRFIIDRLFPFCLVLVGAWILLWLVGPTNGEPTYPAIQTVSHAHFTLTTYSDGSIDISPIQILDARSARRLARRLEQAEDMERERKRVEIAARATPASKATALSTKESLGSPQCQATASSTKRRCKNRVSDGSPFCVIHRN